MYLQDIFKHNVSIYIYIYTHTIASISTVYSVEKKQGKAITIVTMNFANHFNIVLCIVIINLIIVQASTSNSQLPNFPTNWQVHEEQYADVPPSIVKWEGTVYNDQTVAPHAGCSKTSSEPSRNCSAVAYVDDNRQKSTYYFYEPERSIRGITYFVQYDMHSTCYCDMVTLGRWIQCEIAESLCNPNMLKKGKLDPRGAKFKGETVDVVTWDENLFFASSKMRIYVKEGSNVPVQYYTTFSEGNKSLGYNQVNMTQFMPKRPDPSNFILPYKVSGTCADHVCTTYETRRKQGYNPIAAFTGWK